MRVPRTRYARTPDGVHIAYQVYGDGPVDLVLVHAWISNVEVYWEWPGFRRLMDALARYATVIHFDKRGLGLSDRLVSIPTFEARLDDILAVLEAEGIERACLFGYGDGAPLAAAFAASHPERVAAIVLDGHGAFTVRRDETNPYGMTDEEFTADAELQRRVWGNPAEVMALLDLTVTADSVLSTDETFTSWFAKLMRHAAGPGDIAALDQVWFATDARPVIELIGVPTALLSREGWPSHELQAHRRLAARLPSGRSITVAGTERAPWEGHITELADAIGTFIRAVATEEAAMDRVLATVVFADVVASTERVTRLGDQSWKSTVEAHHRRVRALLVRYRGREVDTAGDGFFATFDGPARAVRYAQAVAAAASASGLEVRAGVHTGEVTEIDGKVGGLAVVIGSRVAGTASPGEVRCTRTVHDLVAGSGLEFVDLGEHLLKGIDDPWRLYRVAADREQRPGPTEALLRGVEGASDTGTAASSPS